MAKQATHPGATLLLKPWLPWQLTSLGCHREELWGLEGALHRRLPSTPFFPMLTIARTVEATVHIDIL